MDQRIEKTFSSLQNSMRALLTETSWKDISVQMLCDHANVSRSTFYAHFKSKNDLLDSLLSLFEQAMLNDNNERAICDNGKFKFLPILLNHVAQNRHLFCKNNTEEDGYPIAIRFSNLINRLVSKEIDLANQSHAINSTTVQFISGGIYSALVHWSGLSGESMHFELLEELDEINTRILSGIKR